jgi:hypothetical protein
MWYVKIDGGIHSAGRGVRRRDACVRGLVGRVADQDATSTCASVVRGNANGRGRSCGWIQHRNAVRRAHHRVSRKQVLGGVFVVSCWLRGRSESHVPVRRHASRVWLAGSWGCECSCVGSAAIARCRALATSRFNQHPPIDPLRIGGCCGSSIIGLRSDPL